MLWWRRWIIRNAPLNLISRQCIAEQLIFTPTLPLFHQSVGTPYRVISSFPAILAVVMCLQLYLPNNVGFSKHQNRCGVALSIVLALCLLWYMMTCSRDEIWALWANCPFLTSVLVPKTGYFSQLQLFTGWDVLVAFWEFIFWCSFVWKGSHCFFTKTKLKHSKWECLRDWLQKAIYNLN